MIIKYMRHLFEGGVSFVGGLRRVQHLFEGGVYSRATFERINMVSTFFAMITALSFSSLFPSSTNRNGILCF